MSVRHFPYKRFRGWLHKVALKRKQNKNKGELNIQEAQSRTFLFRISENFLFLKQILRDCLENTTQNGQSGRFHS